LVLEPGWVLKLGTKITALSFEFASLLRVQSERLFFLNLFHETMEESSNSSNFMQLAIPIFDGFYDHLEMLLEILLHSKEYLCLIEKGVVMAPPEQLKNNKKLVDESKLKDLRQKIIVFNRLINQPWSCQRHLRLYAQ